MNIERQINQTCLLYQAKNIADNLIQVSKLQFTMSLYNLGPGSSKVRGNLNH